MTYKGKESEKEYTHTHDIRAIYIYFFYMGVLVLSCFNSYLTLCDPWTVPCQAPLFMGFSRQEYWNGLPCPPPGDPPDPGIEPTSPVSPALADRFFTTSTTWEAHITHTYKHIFKVIYICVCVCVCVYSWITVLHIWGLYDIVNQLYINRNMSILPEQHKKPTLQEYTHSHQGWTWLGKHSLQESGGTPGTLLQTQTLSPERKPLMWQDVVRLYCSFYVFAAALQKKPSALIQLTSQSAVFEDRCMGDGCVTCSCGCMDEAPHPALGKCPWGAWALAETPKLRTTAKKHLPCCHLSARSSHSGLC